MNFDRGFIKWQPFNSVTSSKVILNSMTPKEKVTKPFLFPEAQMELNSKINAAFYAKDLITIKYYEQNTIKTSKVIITKLFPTSNTLELNHSKIISFNQIINII